MPPVAAAVAPSGLAPPAQADRSAIDAFSHLIGLLKSGHDEAAEDLASLPPLREGGRQWLEAEAGPDAVWASVWFPAVPVPAPPSTPATQPGTAVAGISGAAVSGCAGAAAGVTAAATKPAADAAAVAARVDVAHGAALLAKGHLVGDATVDSKQPLAIAVTRTSTAAGADAATVLATAVADSPGVASTKQVTDVATPALGLHVSRVGASAATGRHSDATAPATVDSAPLLVNAAGSRPGEATSDAVAMSWTRTLAGATDLPAMNSASSAATFACEASSAPVVQQAATAPESAAPAAKAVADPKAVFAANPLGAVKVATAARSLPDTMPASDRNPVMDSKPARGAKTASDAKPVQIATSMSVDAPKDAIVARASAEAAPVPRDEAATPARSHAPAGISETSNAASASNASSVPASSAQAPVPVARAEVPAAPATIDVTRSLARFHVAEQVVWALGEGLSEIRLNLHPAELGEIQVQMKVNGDKVHVEFHAPDAAVRDVVQTSLPNLSSLLAVRGLQLDQAQVFAPKVASPTMPGSSSGGSQIVNPGLAPLVRRLRRSGLLDDYV